MTFEDVLYGVEDHVAFVTINRPEVRNALRTQTYQELRAAVELAADDDHVGVIVIQGQGDKAFCSGGDVSQQRGRGPGEGRKHLQHVLKLGHAMRGCGKPIIAAVRGYCVGAGHELHLMADLTVSADNGVFGQVGPRVGSVPVWGATEILPQVVGEKRARELVYTTRFLSAEEALDWGLINRVAPLDELDAAVRELADRLLDMSPQSLRVAKTSMNYAVDAMYPAFTHGVEVLAQLYGTEEQVEGAAAFKEKRRPDYRRFRGPEPKANDDD